jgi:dCTP deaminase
MFLTRQAIREAVENGDVVISPFRPENLSPNSYDVTLNPQLLVYDFTENQVLDVKRENATLEFSIPEDGFVLQPGMLYIGMTNETAISKRYIPMFEGRSSMGRLGINTHITAGFGDIGWGFEKRIDGTVHCHFPTWTLEITVVHPVRVYPNIRIGQVFFVEPKGEIEWYSGKYGKQRRPQASQAFLDFPTA